MKRSGGTLTVRVDSEAVSLELEISNAGELIESSAWVELKLGIGRRQ